MQRYKKKIKFINFFVLNIYKNFNLANIYIWKLKLV